MRMSTANSMSVEIQLCEDLVDDVYVPSEKLLDAWACSVLQRQSIDNAELFIRVVGKAESQNLNKSYRDKDTPTNVLSFPLDAPEYIVPRMLGDLVICADIVEAESLEQKKLRDAHWAHMVVHGVLHLLGFDHQGDEQAQEMEEIEIAVMQELGFANPYE